MAWPGTDPQGIAAERIKLNALVVQLSGSVANYVGDTAGLRDLQTKLTEANFRLTALSTPNTATPGLDYLDGTSYAFFGLEHVST